MIPHLKPLTEVGLDPINKGVQPDVLQRGRAGMARQRSKSQDVRTAIWNVSSMVSRSGEVLLHRRKIDFCCAQETRWKGESARMLGANGGRYKFFWQGCNKGTAGVGVFIAERWIDSVVNVVRVNERIMYVKLVIGKQIVNIVSAYAPQVGLSAEERMTSGTALSLCSLEFLSKKAFSLVATWMAMLEEMQTGMVVSMVVWDWYKKC